MPRDTWESLSSLVSFAYGAITLCGSTFQTSSARHQIFDSIAGPQRLRRLPATPPHQLLRDMTVWRFGLFPVRSPLLRESLLLSFPRATKMFQFARLPTSALCVQAETTPHYRRQVAPFGDPRVQACLQLTGAVSLLATSFIGSQCQGIHRTPFFA